MTRSREPFPILYVADVERSVAFYRDAFDFELCVYADDVDVAAERLRALGAREIASPADQPWGERLAYFEDPEGHRLHITAPLQA
jgi:uncharacterized glyoxalase superfamily protein PhnB